MRRNGATARAVSLHGDDGEFDRELWSRIPPAERLALVWDMALESLEWRGERARYSRLQKSVCRVERG
jgi:hypothetical protein